MDRAVRGGALALEGNRGFIYLISATPQVRSCSLFTCETDSLLFPSLGLSSPGPSVSLDPISIWSMSCFQLVSAMGRSLSLSSDGLSLSLYSPCISLSLSSAGLSLNLYSVGLS